MLNLNFKQGLSNNLPNADHNPGTIYLLTDLHELYYDKENSDRVKITDTDLILFSIEDSIELDI